MFHLLCGRKEQPLYKLNNTLCVHEEHLSVSLPLQGRCMAVQNICYLQQTKYLFVVRMHKQYFLTDNYIHTYIHHTQLILTMAKK